MIPKVSEIYTDPKFMENWRSNPAPILEEDPEDVKERLWIARIVMESKGPEFTFAEIGAGYGRWSVYAAACASEYRPDLSVHILAAEAEPTHFQWLKEHLENNGVTRYTLFDSPVARRKRFCLFYIGNPSGWYGQAINHHPELNIWIEALRGRRFSLRRTITLADVFASVQKIDLVDMDIQGDEWPVLKGIPEPVLNKIHWLYIGTHSRRIEMNLWDLLNKKGWECHENIAIDPINGFTDGIQVWRNPKW